MADSDHEWNPMQEDFNDSSFNAYKRGPGSGYRGKPQRDDEMFKLFVASIPPTMDKSGIENIFRNFGDPSGVFVNAELGKMKKTWGFVCYATHKEAELAIRELNGVPPLRLFVKFARSPEEKEKLKYPLHDPLPTSIATQPMQQETKLFKGIGRGRGVPAAAIQPGQSLDVRPLARSNSQEFEPYLGSIYDSTNRTMMQQSGLQVTPAGRTSYMGRGYTRDLAETPDRPLTKAEEAHRRAISMAVEKMYTRIENGYYKYGVELPLQSGSCLVCRRMTTQACQRCKAWYCSPGCQRLDWPRHKDACIPMPALEDSMEGIHSPICRTSLDPVLLASPRGCLPKDRELEPELELKSFASLPFEKSRASLPYEKSRTSLPYEQPCEKPRASLPYEQLYEKPRASLPSEQPCEKSRASLPYEQPCEKPRASLPSEQPCEEPRASLPREKPRASLPSEQPRENPRASLPSEQPREKPRASLPYKQPRALVSSEKPREKPHPEAALPKGPSSQSHNAKGPHAERQHHFHHKGRGKKPQGCAKQDSAGCPSSDGGWTDVSSSGQENGLYANGQQALKNSEPSQKRDIVAKKLDVGSEVQLENATDTPHCPHAAGPPVPRLSADNFKVVTPAPESNVVAKPPAQDVVPAAPCGQELPCEKSAVLPDNVFTKVKVVVPVESWEFWVQLMAAENLLLDTMGAVIEHCLDAPAARPSRVGEVCAASYEGIWYRARVESLDPELTVRYIDFGNVETCTADQLRTLPASVLKTPGQAVRIRLAVGTPEKFLNQEENSLLFVKPVGQAQDGAVLVHLEGVTYPVVQESSTTPLRKPGAAMLTPIKSSSFPEAQEGKPTNSAAKAQPATTPKDVPPQTYPVPPFRYPQSPAPATTPKVAQSATPKAVSPQYPVPSFKYPQSPSTGAIPKVAPEPATTPKVSQSNTPTTTPKVPQSNTPTTTPNAVPPQKYPVPPFKYPRPFTPDTTPKVAHSPAPSTTPKVAPTAPHATTPKVDQSASSTTTPKVDQSATRTTTPKVDQSATPTTTPKVVQPPTPGPTPSFGQKIKALATSTPVEAPRANHPQSSTPFSWADECSPPGSPAAGKPSPDTCLTIMKAGMCGVGQLCCRRGPKEFLLRLVCEKFLKDYPGLEDIVYGNIPVVDPPCKPQVGDLVVAPYDYHGQELHYRAYMTGQNSEGSYRVHMCDMGRTVTVPRVWQMPAPYDQMPELTVRCRVAKFLVPQEQFDKDHLTREETKYSFHLTSCGETPEGLMANCVLMDLAQKPLAELVLRRWEPPRPLTGLQCIRVESGSQVVLSVFFGPNALYVRPASGLAKTNFVALVNDVGTHCSRSKVPTFLPQVGELVGCKFAADGNFYRAQVTASDIVREQVRVSFVDFGNDDLVGFETIRQLSQELCKVPCQAIKVAFKDVAECPLNPEATKYLTELNIRDIQLKLEYSGSITDGVVLTTLDGVNVNDRLNGLLVPGWKKAIQNGESPSGGRLYMESEMEYIEIPLGEDIPFLALYVMDNGVVMGCHGQGDMLLHITGLTPEINSYCASQPQLPYLPRTKELCLALYEDGAWYRAMCLEVKDTVCSVVFIDYGNITVVRHHDIRRMVEDFGEFPAAASMCYVQGLTPEMKSKLNDHIVPNTLYKVTVLKKKDKGEYMIEMPSVVKAMSA